MSDDGLKKSRKRIGRFATAPLWLILDANVKDFAIRLYALLAAKYASRDDHTCFPSRRVLAADLGVTKSTIDIALDQLRAAGALRIQHQQNTKGGRSANLYTLVFDMPVKTEGGSLKNQATPSLKNQATLDRKIRPRVARKISPVIEEPESGEPEKSSCSAVTQADTSADGVTSTNSQPDAGAALMGMYGMQWTAVHGRSYAPRRDEVATFATLARACTVDEASKVFHMWFADNSAYLTRERHPVLLLVKPTQWAKYAEIAAAEQRPSGRVLDVEASKVYLAKLTKTPSTAEEKAAADAAFRQTMRQLQDRGAARRKESAR